MQRKRWSDGHRNKVWANYMDNDNRSGALQEGEEQTRLISYEASDADNETGTRELTIDEMFVEGVGEFGNGQRAHFALASLAWISEALHVLIMIFSERLPEWRCVSPAPNATSIPCTQSTSLCSLSRDQWEWVDKAASSVSEFNLVCEDEWKAGLVGSMFFLGFLIGAGVIGLLSDGILGRKRALFCCYGLAAISCYLTAVMPTYWTYVGMRLVSGCAAGGLGLVAFVLGYEPIGPKYRGELGILAQYFFTFGLMLLTLIAYFQRHWRVLYVATAIPTTLFLFTWWPLFESPRWLLVRGRAADAVEVLAIIARRNGTNLPRHAVLKPPAPSSLTSASNARQPKSPVSPLAEGFISRRRPSSFEGGEGGHSSAQGPAVAQDCRGSKENKGMQIYQVFKLPITRRRILVMLFNWYTCSTVYYGLSLNVGSLGPDIYVSSFLNALVEVPSYLVVLWFLSRAGRRLTLAWSLLLSGICCLLSGLVEARMPESCGNSADSCSSQTLLIILALAGKFGIAAAFTIIFVYTSELFPTVVRNAALGICSQMARLGGIIAPQIVVLGRQYAGLPFAVFGSLGLLAGMYTFLLDETLNRALYETMEMLEEGETKAVLPRVARLDTTDS